MTESGGTHGVMRGGATLVKYIMIAWARLMELHLAMELGVGMRIETQNALLKQVLPEVY